MEMVPAPTKALDQGAQAAWLYRYAAATDTFVKSWYRPYCLVAWSSIRCTSKATRGPQSAVAWGLVRSSLRGIAYFYNTYCDKGTPIQFNLLVYVWAVGLLYRVEDLVNSFSATMSNWLLFIGLVIPAALTKAFDHNTHESKVTTVYWLTVYYSGHERNIHIGLQYNSFDTWLSKNT